MIKKDVAVVSFSDMNSPDYVWAGTGHSILICLYVFEGKYFYLPYTMLPFVIAMDTDNRHVAFMAARVTPDRLVESEVYTYNRPTDFSLCRHSVDPEVSKFEPYMPSNAIPHTKSAKRYKGLRTMPQYPIMVSLCKGIKSDKTPAWFIPFVSKNEKKPSAMIEVETDAAVQDPTGQHTPVLQVKAQEEIPKFGSTPTVNQKVAPQKSTYTRLNAKGFIQELSTGFEKEVNE